MRNSGLAEFVEDMFTNWFYDKWVTYKEVQCVAKNMQNISIDDEVPDKCKYHLEHLISSEKHLISSE